jgi:hypothetical protein
VAHTPRYQELSLWQRDNEWVIKASWSRVDVHPHARLPLAALCGASDPWGLPFLRLRTAGQPQPHGHLCLASALDALLGCVHLQADSEIRLGRDRRTEGLECRLVSHLVQGPGRPLSKSAGGTGGPSSRLRSTSLFSVETKRPQRSKTGVNPRLHTTMAFKYDRFWPNVSYPFFSLQEC